MWTCLSGLLDILRALRRDENGATILIFGLTLIPVIFGVGMSVDYGRALAARQRLGAAIDAAALAAAAWPDLTEAQIEAKALEYVSAHFPPGSEGAPDQINVSTSEETLSISADGHVETTFMRIAGINQIAVGAFAEVSLKQKKIELVMVLDNTGSMSWSNKIGALKNASKKLVDILKSDEKPNEESVKIGLVPFAAAVNIGSDKLNSGWIDVAAQSDVASEDFQAGVNVLELYNQISNRSWNGCVRARTTPLDTRDDPPGGGPGTLWAPYFAPDEPDFGSYANRYASDAGYGGSYWDYDARQRYTGKYSGLSVWGWGSKGPAFNCEMPAVTPLTQIKGEIVSGIDQMIASGNTVIPAGLAWGWRLISPTEPFTEGAAYDDNDVVKAIILLTDGENMVSGGLGTHNRSQYSAYGFAQSGHLGPTNGYQAESVLNDKTETLCTNIKAEGVRLYTITFQLGDGPIKELMRDCASAPEMYYDSPSNEQLETVFADIAKGLNDLRLSK